MLKWRTKRCFILLIILLGLTTFQFSFLRHQYSDSLIRALKGPISYDHSELIRYIKNEILEPPSSKPYNLSQHVKSKINLNDSFLFYRKYLQEMFKLKRGGFFVEAGALDGESMSNTLWLEKEQGWNGLLIEPDSANYIALKRKHRKAWTAKACISVEKYPKMERLSAGDLTGGTDYQDIRYRAMGRILDSKLIENSTIDLTVNSYYNRQCFPLESFLLALNVSSIDLLSLDVESVEESILRNFDFQKFDIKVLFIEWWDFKSLHWLHNFLDGKGYRFVANVVGDVIYAKKDTEYIEIIDAKYPDRHFTLFHFEPKPKNVTS